MDLLPLLRPYLPCGEWIKLCNQVRLSPDNRPDLRAVTAIAPRAAKDSPNSVCWAYLVGQRELHIDLPPFNGRQDIVDGFEAAQLIRQDFLRLKNRRIDQLYVHLTVPLSGQHEFLAALNTLISRNAPYLIKLSVSFERCRHTGDAVSEPPPQSLSRAAESADYLRLDRLFLPHLTFANIGVPLTADGVQTPRLNELYLRYHNRQEIHGWHTANVHTANSLRATTIRGFDTLLCAGALSLESLLLYGDAEGRASDPYIRDLRFLPKLKSLNLGWTTEAELNVTLNALKPSVHRAGDIITKIGDDHPAAYSSILNAAGGVPFNSIAALPGTASVTLPPALPVLSTLHYASPARVGLADVHLELATFLPEVRRIPQCNGALKQQSLHEGVYFSEGISNVTLHQFIHFRIAFRSQAFFVAYRQLPQASISLYRVCIRPINGEQAILPAHTRAQQVEPQDLRLLAATRLRNGRS